jgi:hypothetical protein
MVSNFVSKLSDYPGTGMGLGLCEFPNSLTVEPGISENATPSGSERMFS